MHRRHGFRAHGQRRHNIHYISLAVRPVRIIVAIAADCFLALAIVTAGLLAWSPGLGVSAAREVISRRRTQRARETAIRGTASDIWIRHLRRNQPDTSQLPARWVPHP